MPLGSEDSLKVPTRHSCFLIWLPLRCPFAVDVPSLSEGYASWCSPWWSFKLEGDQGSLATVTLLTNIMLPALWISARREGARGHPCLCTNLP